MKEREQYITVVCINTHPYSNQGCKYIACQKYSAIRIDYPEAIGEPYYIITDANGNELLFNTGPNCSRNNCFDEFFEPLDINRKRKIESILKDLECEK